MAMGARWHDDDRFWKTYGPWMFDEKRYAGTPGEVDSIVKLLSLGADARVLDLCCGPGRHSVELARRGFEVVGVDRTAAYLSQARKRAQAEGVKVEFVRQDMRRFTRTRAFDAAINMYTSFGYFKNPADDARVLRNLHRSLKPGAKLLIDLMGTEVVARQFRKRDWHEERGVLFLEERNVSPDWTWVENRWILLKGGRRKQYIVSHRLYPAKDLSSLLRNCGFKAVKIFGNLAGSPYDHNASRLVVVATAR
jgi:SAM-dependent methyltransferase